jgi:hypothetical protein
MADVEISVPRGAKELHTVEVSAPGIVSWSVKTAAFDVGVEVRWTPTPPTTSSPSPSPSSRPYVAVQPSLRMEDDKGSFVCATAGRLEFLFDNSFSVLRAKTVTLRLSKAPLPEPSEADAQAGGAGARDSALAAAADALDTHVLNILCNHGIDKFFLNDFDAAERFFEREKNRVPIFALSFSTLAWLRSLMTWEPEEIAGAHKRLKNAAAVAEAYMPKDSGLLGGLKGVFGGGGGTESPADASTSTPSSSTPSSSADSLSPAQLEASLIYAEVTLLASLLHLMEESVLGLVRCGLGIRSAWTLLQRIDRALGSRVSAIRDGPELRTGAFSVRDMSAAGASLASATDAQLLHVQSSLAFNFGAFNVVASMLPSIVLKVLSFAGFPSDRRAGMQCLRECLVGGGVRSPLAALLMLGMRVLMPSFHSGDISEHVPEAHAIIDSILTTYPDSALFLWMAGRLARMRRDPAAAAALFARCTAAGGVARLPQLAHLCHYELSWCHAFAHDWASVLPLYATLQRENAWSKAFYAYMQACALLHLGRVAEARAKMVEVLRLGSRLLGGRVIPAEQHAVRRASEFVALTSCASSASSASAVAEPTPAELGGGPFVRVRLPDTVPVGSAAHRAILTYPVVAPGLESMYFFNSFPQMQARALHYTLVQCDAMLAGVAAGGVFDAGSAMWATVALGEAGEGAAAWGSVAEAAEVAERTPASLRAAFDAAAGVPLKGFTVDAAAVSADAKAAAAPAAAPAAAAAAPALAPASSGGFFRGLGSVVSAVASAATTVASAATTVATSAVSAVASAAGASGIVGASSLSTFAAASPLLPVHAVATLALIRGAACGGLGRMDEAAACYSWVMAAGAAGRLRRDLHLYGYAVYELGMVHLETAKALTLGAAAGAAAGTAGAEGSASASAGAAASGTASVEPDAETLARRARILASTLAHETTPADARARCVELLKTARGIKEDFNWRVRLHIRSHLAIDELRQSKDAAGAAAAAAAAVAMEEADGADDGAAAAFAAATTGPGATTGAE